MASIGNRLRFEVLRRDGFACRYCGATGDDAALEVDHIEPRSKGGSDDIDNLITACFACNRGKGAETIMPEDKPMTATHPGIVGKCFVFIGSDNLQHSAGIIRSRLTETLYLVQFYEAWEGTPYTMTVLDVNQFVTHDPQMMERPPRFILFEDVKHLDHWLAGWGKRHEPK